MFTGLIEETGKIEAIEHGADAVKLAVSAAVCLGGTNTGDSIAVNGCCLTVTKVTKRGKSRGIQFDLLRETWDVTNLNSLRPGSAVNLERALALGQRMGGHFVTGHVDAVGKVRKWKKQGNDWLLDIDAPASLMRLCGERFGGDRRYQPNVSQGAKARFRCVDYSTYETGDQPAHAQSRRHGQPRNRPPWQIRTAAV